jgi:XTP/dITP diphosphohydrolase
MDLRFLTKNPNKAAEFQKLFSGTRYVIVPAPLQIDEIQTDDMEALVRDKAIKAFAKIRRPIFVDHTGLYFDFLGGFPGGLTEIFWNKLENEKLAHMIGRSDNPATTAVTLIAYCDGRTIEVFSGSLRGKISNEPRGPEGFQWDPIFIPDGEDETFAQMGERKNEISMRRLAIDQFISHLDKTA